MAKRSPICSKALTLDELRQLPSRTELIYFNWRYGSHERVVFERVIGDTDRAIVEFMRRTRTATYADAARAAALGLVPFEPGEEGVVIYQGWHALKVLVLPEDVASLPRGIAPKGLLLGGRL